MDPLKNCFIFLYFSIFFSLFFFLFQLVKLTEVSCGDDPGLLPEPCVVFLESAEIHSQDHICAFHFFHYILWFISGEF